MFKKVVTLLLVVIMTLSVTIGGTIAYLTDRDSEANVFTVGNVEIDLSEDFAQGATLLPGATIEKKPVITNTGKNDAWVWAKIAFPAALDNDDASLNVVHFNYEADYVNDKMWTWKDNSGWMMEPNVSINGATYNVYTVLYQTALKPDAVTEPVMTQVYMDTNVDIDPNGDWYIVENGNATFANWNSTTNGNPIIYVSAYAVQKEGFDTVQDAYAAYKTQWGTNGDEWATPAAVMPVSDSAALADAVANAAEPVILELGSGEYDTNIEVPGGSDITIQGNGSTVLNGQIATTSSTEGTLTLRNLTINVDDSIVDSTGISQTGKSAIAIWGNQTVICENVTFNMSLKDSTAITSWWDTGVGTSIIVKNCTFNCNGQRPIRATGNVTVENTTFNDPYRYAVQLTAKADTATELDKAIINFRNNTIVNGANGKAFVYGIQLEGADYGCNDCIINGSGNIIVDGGTESAMYYCECGKVQHETITWNTEIAAVHEN